MATPAKKSRKAQSSELAKILEDIRALKNRLLTMELARLDEERSRAVAKASQGGPAVKGGTSQAEARKMAEAESEQKKSMLEGRYKRVDQGIQRIADLLQEVGNLEEYRGRLQSFAKTLEEQHRQNEVERRGFDAQRTEIEKLRAELSGQKDKLKKAADKAKDRSDNLDIVERARELDRREAELEESLKQYKEEVAQLHRSRQELNRDMEHLGRVRADLEAERERFVGDQQKGGSAADGGLSTDEVISRLSHGFETFLRQILEEDGRPEKPKKSKGTGRTKREKDTSVTSDPLYGKETGLLKLPTEDISDLLDL